MTKRTLIPMLLCIALTPTTTPVHAEMAYEVEWIRQLGTSTDDRSHSVAVDGSGNVFISGYTYGDLDGPGAGTLAGGRDAFLTKYDASGTVAWT